MAWIVMDVDPGVQEDLEEAAQLSYSSNEELNNLLCRYKYGMIGTLNELSEMVEKAIGKKYSQSTLARKVQNLDKLMQKEMELGQQPLEQIRESGQNGFCGYLTLSQRLNNSLITLPEPGGYRQYVRSKQTRSNRCEYYRCNNCHKVKRKTGYGRISYIRIRDGIVLRGRSSAHHPDCKVLNETDIIATQMDRQSRREILDGKDPYDAYRKNFEKAVELAATFDESSSNSKKFNVATTYPSWRSVCKTYKRIQRKGMKQKMGGKGEMGECSYEIGEESDNSKAEDITPDSHNDDSFVRSTSSMTSSERTCEMDNSNAVVEHISAGFSKLDEVSPSPEEAVDGTPDGTLEQLSDEEISVDDDNISTTNNETTGQKMPGGDQLSESNKLLPSETNDNDSNLPVAHLLESSQHTLDDTSNIDDSSSSQSHPLPSTRAESRDSNDSNEIVGGDNTSKTTNEAHPKHFLKRDPQTGRLVLCKRLPLKRVMNSSCIQQSLLNSHKKARRSSPHQDKTTDEFISDSFVSDVKKRSTAKTFKSYEPQTSQSPAQKSRPNKSLRNEVVDVNDPSDNNDASARRMNESNARDNCDALLQILGESIREIEAVSRRRAHQFMIDLLKVNGRYRCSLRGNQ